MPRQLLTGLSLIIILVFAALGLQNLKVDNSLSTWFSKNDSAFIEYQQFLKHFGSDEVMVTVIIDSSGFNSIEKLKKLAALTDNLSQVPGISNVSSITHLPVILQRPKAITINQFIAQNHGQEKLNREWKKLQNLKTIEQFISSKYQSVTLYSTLDTLALIEEQRPEIIEQVKAKTSEFFPKNNIYHGGTGVLYNAINQETIKESTLFSTLSFVILLIVFWWFTRRLKWVALLVAVIISTLISLFGLMGWLGFSINMTIVALAPLVMVVSVAMLMHFYQHRSKNQLTTVLKPVLFTTLTTAFGLFSLIIADTKITREYGLFAGLGVIISFLFTAVYLSVFNMDTSQSKKITNISLIAIQTIYKCMQWASKQRYLVVFVAVLIVVISSLGINQLKTDTDTFRFLPANHTAISDHKKIEQLTGGYLPLDFLVYAEDEKVNRDSLLRAIKEAQEHIEKLPFVSHSISLADIQTDLIRLQSRQINPFPFNLNETVNKIATVSKLANVSNQVYRISVYGPSCSASQLNERTDSMLVVLNNHLGNIGRVKKSGYLPLYSQIIKNILHDQLSSIALALLIIILLMGMLFRSFRILAVAIPANILPLLALGGIMGFFNIWLDIGTVTIAAAMLGIIVDDTIHLLYYIQKYRKDGLSLQESLQNTAKRTGQAVVKTTIILVLGFGVLAFSSVSTLSSTGWLIALTATFALLTDLFLIPALLAFKE